MKTKSILLGTAVALFFVIFAGLVFLPAIISSDLLKPRLLQSVNQHLPGQLQIEAWTFKWFSGISARGITYDHRQENLLVKVSELKGYRGLVHLMINAGNLAPTIRPWPTAAPAGWCIKIPFFNLAVWLCKQKWAIHFTWPGPYYTRFTPNIRPRIQKPKISPPPIPIGLSSKKWGISPCFTAMR